ncbi:MAG TPA: hypothetical protein VK707_08800 [Solirubrobacteraceae bacterium]|nr:hypothetical protein [Solirubrobacteraceae bacterium]
MEDAFNDDTLAAFGQHYLDALLTTWREIMQSMRRSTLLLVALLITFVLLKGAKHAEVTVGPIKLTNVVSVLTIIPALISLLLYEFVSLISAHAVYRNVVGETMRIMHRGVYDSDLEYLLGPATVTFFGGGSRTWEELRSTRPGLSRRFLDATTLLIITAIIGSAFGFIYYAYRYLYQDSHANGLAVSISLAVTVLVLARTVALMFDTDDQERIVRRS